MRQLDIGNLQLGPLAAEEAIILAPIELERLTRTKGQRNASAAPRRLVLSLPIRPPVTGKDRSPAIRTGEAQSHEIRMQLLHRAPRLARLARPRTLSQPESFSATGPSLLGRTEMANFGSTVPAFRCFLTYAGSSSKVPG